MSPVTTQWRQLTKRTPVWLCNFFLHLRSNPRSRSTKLESTVKDSAQKTETGRQATRPRQLECKMLSVVWILVPMCHSTQNRPRDRIELFVFTSEHKLQKIAPPFHSRFIARWTISSVLCFRIGFFSLTRFPLVPQIKRWLACFESIKRILIRWTWPGNRET